MPTRILSWQQLVLENDPDWVRRSLNPAVWEFSNGRIFVDPAQVYAPLPDSGLTNVGGVLTYDGANTPYPTSTNKLLPGAIWSNGGSVSVVAGGVAQPGAQAMFFGKITSDQLLLFGGANLPKSSPTAGSLQLWNNSGVVNVA